MTQAGQQNYDAASTYVNSPDATWSADKAAAYSNPYQQQVQADTLATMNNQNQQQNAALADQAQAAHAYGGTRFAVQAAQQTKDQNTARNQYVDQSNAAAYNDAEQQYDADRSAKMGGYQLLTQVLAGTPKNVTTTGTSNGTQVQQTNPGFLNSVLGLGQLGLSAYSTFSDRRCKRDIQWLRNIAPGLGLYRYSYVWDGPGDEPREGVMADEVERVAPEAMGPVTMGLKTVNYDALREKFAW